MSDEKNGLIVEAVRKCLAEQEWDYREASGDNFATFGGDDDCVLFTFGMESVDEVRWMVRIVVREAQNQMVVYSSLDDNPYPHDRQEQIMILASEMTARSIVGGWYPDLHDRTATFKLGVGLGGPLDWGGVRLHLDATAVNRLVHDAIITNMTTVNQWASTFIRVATGECEVDELELDNWGVEE